MPGKMPFTNRDFYFAPELSEEAVSVTLSGDEYRHLARAARHRAGDVVGLTNGTGLVAAARVESIGRDRAVLLVEELFPGYGEPAVQLTLAVGLIVPSRFEWLVEKAVEVGVTRIVPLVTQWSERRRGVRLERLRRIAVAATKQCQRAVVPEVAEPVGLPELLETVDQFDLTVLAEAESETSAAATLRRTAQRTEGKRSVLALVGPEGGFSAQERQLAAGAGAVEANLGPRRLRTETAALHLSILLLNIPTR